jgi:hypothetical protein
MTLSIAGDTTSSLPERSALRHQVNWNFRSPTTGWAGLTASLLKLKPGWARVSSMRSRINLAPKWKPWPVRKGHHAGRIIVGGFCDQPGSKEPQHDIRTFVGRFVEASLGRTRGLQVRIGRANCKSFCAAHIHFFAAHKNAH